MMVHLLKPIDSTTYCCQASTGDTATNDIGDATCPTCLDWSIHDGKDRMDASVKRRMEIGR